MFDQSFALSDLPKVLILAFLEIVLSADNVVVLGVVISKLAKPLRKKAFYVGYLSAFAIRVLALIALSFLIQFRWIQLVGAAYLAYLSLGYFLRKKKPLPYAGQTNSFWTTIFLVEFLDLIFALDSILAGFGFIGTKDPQRLYSKLWIIYIGGMIGLFAVRYAANLFTYFIEKFSNMEKCAHLMIGWISLKLFYELVSHPPYFDLIFWIGLTCLFFAGFIKKRKQHE